MKTIEIYADTRGFGVCRGCGDGIEWVENVATGKRMPFDTGTLVVERVLSFLRIWANSYRPKPKSEPAKKRRRERRRIERQTEKEK